MQPVYWKGTDHGGPWFESQIIDLSPDIPEGGAAILVLAMRSTTTAEDVAELTELELAGAALARVGYRRSTGDVLWTQQIGTGLWPNLQADPTSVALDKLPYDPERGAPELVLEIQRTDEFGQPYPAGRGTFTVDVRIV